MGSGSGVENADLVGRKKTLSYFFLKVVFSPTSLLKWRKDYNDVFIFALLPLYQSLNHRKGRWVNSDKFGISKFVTFQKTAYFAPSLRVRWS